MAVLLALMKSLIRSYALPALLHDVKRILVIDFAYLGDMVMTSPVYRALKKHYPAAKVEALVFPMSQEVLRMNPYVDEVHVHPTAAQTIDVAMVAKLRKRTYDLGIQMNTSVRNNFILWLIHPRYRLGYDYRHRGCFHNLRVPLATRTARMKYRLDEELELVERAFGWNITERDMIFPVRDETRQTVGKRLVDLGITDRDVLIGVHANSRQTRDLRQWDQKKFAELTDRLIERYHAKIIFTGSESDEEYVSGIIQDIKQKGQVVRGFDFGLEELGALFQRMRLFVTINTGPMHIAIAQKTPTVALIGGTPAHVIFPSHNPRFQYIMDKALEVWDPQPVHHRYTPRMKEIEVDEVMQKVEVAMKSTDSTNVPAFENSENPLP